jgi:hypothetical protein
MEALSANVFVSEDGMCVVRRSDRQLVLLDALPPSQWKWLDQLGRVGFLCVWPSGDSPIASVRAIFRARYPQLREVVIGAGEHFPAGLPIMLDGAYAAVALPDARVVVTNVFDRRGQPREPLSRQAAARLRELPMDRVMSAGYRVTVPEEALAAREDPTDQYSPWSPHSAALFAAVLLLDAVIAWRISVG